MEDAIASFLSSNLAKMVPSLALENGLQFVLKNSIRGSASWILIYSLGMSFENPAPTGTELAGVIDSFAYGTALKFTLVDLGGALGNLQIVGIASSP